MTLERIPESAKYNNPYIPEDEMLEIIENYPDAFNEVSRRTAAAKDKSFRELVEKVRNPYNYRPVHDIFAPVPTNNAKHEAIEDFRRAILSQLPPEQVKE